MAKYVVCDGEGDPCPRCKRPTEIREHQAITEKHLRQPFYYSRWFRCANHGCNTTLVMPERFKVVNVEPSRLTKATQTEGTPAGDYPPWQDGPEDRPDSKISQALGNSPTLDAIAAELGVSPQDLRKALLGLMGE